MAVARDGARRGATTTDRAAAGRRAGFMLLEVLVAAVVAVVLITLLTRLAGDNRHRVEQIRGMSGAMAVARSVLEEASARDRIAAGEHRGMAGAYRWAVVTVPLADRAALSANVGEREGGAADGGTAGPDWILYRIDVAVEAPDGRVTTLGAHRLGRGRS